MTLLDKIKPSFLGVEMDRDEYFRQEGNKIMAVSHVYSFFAIMILALVSFIWDIIHSILPVSSALLLIVSQIANIYFLNGSRNKNILSNEVYSPEEYKEKLSYYRNKSIKATVIWGSWMYLWIEIINPMLMGERYTFEWSTLFINIIGALFFGITIYLVMRYNLKKEFEESEIDD